MLRIKKSARMWRRRMLSDDHLHQSLSGSYCRPHHTREEEEEDEWVTPWRWDSFWFQNRLSFLPPCLSSWLETINLELDYPPPAPFQEKLPSYFLASSSCQHHTYCFRHQSFVPQFWALKCPRANFRCLADCYPAKWSWPINPRFWQHHCTTESNNHFFFARKDSYQKDSFWRRIHQLSSRTAASWLVDCFKHKWFAGPRSKQQFGVAARRAPISPYLLFGVNIFPSSLLL